MIVNKCEKIIIIIKQLTIIKKKKKKSYIYSTKIVTCSILLKIRIKLIINSNKLRQEF